MGTLPDSLAAALDLAFPPGPKQEDYIGNVSGDRRQADRSRPTRPRNRKQFVARLYGCADPDRVLAVVWERMRTPKDPGWHMAGGHVDCGVVHLGLVYVGRGGVPSDIRKIVGRLVRGVPFTENQCVIERRGTEVLEEDLTGRSS